MKRYEIIRSENYRGYKIYVSRNYNAIMQWYCGYVKVPRSHPFFGAQYQEIEDDIEVHGGLTFSGIAIFANGYLIGFDCAHYGDSPEVQNEEYTLNECKKIVDQLIEIEKS